jgi:beta-phosphoglucomutase-like phosphatase (HAD superfamily)
MKSLVLFDIDGTLVRRAGPLHREVLVEAVHRTTGLKTTTDNVPTQGMLDGDILTQMLSNAGASRALIRRNMPSMIEHAQRLYASRCPDLRGCCCIGYRGAA